MKEFILYDENGKKCKVVRMIRNGNDPILFVEVIKYKDGEEVSHDYTEL